MIIGKTNYNYKLSTLTTKTMVHKKIVAAPGYEAPEIRIAEISVEQGFAGSGFGERGYAGDNLSSEENYYEF